MSGRVFPSRRGEKGWCRFKGPKAIAILLLRLRGIEALSRAPKARHYTVTCRDGEFYVAADRHFAKVLDALGIPHHWSRG